MGVGCQRPTGASVYAGAYAASVQDFQVAAQHFQSAAEAAPDGAASRMAIVQVDKNCIVPDTQPHLSAVSCCWSWKQPKCMGPSGPDADVVPRRQQQQSLALAHQQQSAAQ